MGLLGAYERVKLSSAISNYMQGKIDTENFKGVIENAKNHAEYVDNNGKKSLYKKANTVLKNANELDGIIMHFNSSNRSQSNTLSLKEFVSQSNQIINKDKDIRINDGSYISQKIQSCFDAILKAIYSVLSNEQKENVTLKSMKMEIAALREEPSQPHSLSSCRL